MTQGGGEVATLATAVFAERRPSWSHQQAAFPERDAVRAGAALSASIADDVDASSMISASSRASRASTARRRPRRSSAFSKQWIGDHVPRKIDMLSLMSMSDAFFGRVFHGAAAN